MNEGIQIGQIAIKGLGPDYAIALNLFVVPEKKRWAQMDACVKMVLSCLLITFL